MFFQNSLKYLNLILLSGCCFVVMVATSNNDFFVANENLSIKDYLMPGHYIYDKFAKTLLNESLYSFVSDCYSNKNIERNMLCNSYFEMVWRLGELEMSKYENINEINGDIKAMDRQYSVDKFCYRLKNILMKVQKQQQYSFDHLLTVDIFCNKYCIAENLVFDKPNKLSVHLMCKLIALVYDSINKYVESQQLFNKNEIIIRLPPVKNYFTVYIYALIIGLIFIVIGICFYSWCYFCLKKKEPLARNEAYEMNEFKKRYVAIPISYNVATGGNTAESSNFEIIPLN